MVIEPVKLYPALNTMRKFSKLFDSDGFSRRKWLLSDVIGENWKSIRIYDGFSWISNRLEMQTEKN